MLRQVADAMQGRTAPLAALAACLLFLVGPAAAIEPTDSPDIAPDSNTLMLLDDAELNAFSALSGIGGARSTVSGDGVAIGVIREGLLGAEDQPLQVTYGQQMVAGAVDLSDKWAVTGQLRNALAPGLRQTETRLGLRYTTRAGEQLLLAVEPSFGLLDSREMGEARRRSEAELSVGASATYVIGTRWYVSGIAQIDQGMEQSSDGVTLLNEMSLLGGFVTGIRF